MDIDGEVALRTLLVEDNRSEAALVSRLLAMSDRPRFEVIAVHQLSDAMALLAARRVDLVVLDLGLPDVVSELEGLTVMRGAHPDTPIVVLTGVEASDDLRRNVLAAGARACLFKEGLDAGRFHQALAQAADGADEDVVQRTD